MGLFDGTPLERPVAPDDGPPAQESPSAEPSDRPLRVRRERRRGKWCAVIAGLGDDPAAQKGLLKTLRTSLGCGGGVSEDDIVLQGDCRDAVLKKLAELGYRAKASGG
jgi:translation initiation factor 1